MTVSAECATVMRKIPDENEDRWCRHGTSIVTPCGICCTWRTAQTRCLTELIGTISTHRFYHRFSGIPNDHFTSYCSADLSMLSLILASVNYINNNSHRYHLRVVMGNNWNSAELCPFDSAGLLHDFFHPRGNPARLTSISAGFPQLFSTLSPFHLCGFPAAGFPPSPFLCTFLQWTAYYFKAWLTVQATRV